MTAPKRESRSACLIRCKIREHQKDLVSEPLGYVGVRRDRGAAVFGKHRFGVQIHLVCASSPTSANLASV
jgi:hypothetical protein